MQIKMLKKIIFFFFVTFFFTQESKSQYVSLKVADSLFSVGELSEAEKLYEKYKTDSHLPISNSIVLKLAMISEKNDDFAKALYYLTVLYNREPQRLTLNKINEIAISHHLLGYNEDDLSFIFFLFRKYSLYFFLFLLTVAVYSYSVLINKRRNGLPVRSRHKWVVVLYLIALLALLNLPDSYKVAVVVKKQVFLREAPSSAAPIIEKIPEGSKVSVIGQEDQWLHIWWDNKLFYVKQIDVWIVS
jgi:hypothetical protein